MLFFTRKQSQSLVIAPKDIDPSTPIGELLKHPLEIAVLAAGAGIARVGIEADARFVVTRGESRHEPMRGRRKPKI